ncbi:hypothetical protein [Lentzea flaviverrucosa]|uniref:Uncharacterized protein n=1 Tax=Lentzea flaviverrucosa TaxID=200379 RepID=A0A1H9CM38_9PSEU|nr:hypothetical protein [Lentzea flaviverrucosa]RDI24574.1 hypothetical protein DFR72_109154 [Lentzea flaviverrucosa]SEQ01678.1 hypothetical protein SAMN05216195_101809 [Lentzea flaviverrucosa]
MKQRKVFASLVSLVAVMSVVASPQAAAAAECVYSRQDLPLPAGVTSAWTEGSSTNNSRIVGSYDDVNMDRGVLWVNSALRVLPGPVEPFQHVYPEAVNNTSVVVGRQEWRAMSRTAAQAFRYENGTYTFLETAADENSRAVAVNDTGDALGEVWKRENPAERTVVLWPRNGARKSFGPGYPIGVNAQREIVLAVEGWGWIVDGDTGARIALPGARSPMVLDNERVLAYDWRGEGVEGQIAEWDVTGAKVNEHRGGYQPFGRNNSGTVFGTLQPNLGSGPTLWRANSRSPVVADKLPMEHYYGDVTDAATLIGTYQADQQLRPARWLWQCS